MRKFKVGDHVTHVSGIGETYQVILDRPEYGDALAVTNQVDPRVIRVINEDNWTLA